MGSIPDPGELSHPPSPSASPPPPSSIPSFDDFQKQTSLMTSCTLLWKELSDHFTTLEQDLRRKSEALKRKIQTLDDQTNNSLKMLERRDITIAGSVELAIGRADASKRAALKLLNDDTASDHNNHITGEVDDGEGLLLKLRGFCLRMDHTAFWKFVIVRKKELDILRVKIQSALGDCIDPPRFVLEAISEVFPVDRRGEKSNDLGWACVLLLESLIPVVIDPVIGKERLLVTPTMKKRAKDIAETWKASLEERGGIENVKTPDVHTFLQHLVTFGIVKNEDFNLYRKLVIASAWRKQMPKLAVSLGLGDDMPDMIEELISRGQQVDAVHFTHEVGLVDKFPPVPLLKAFLEDSKKAATAILEDPNNSGRAAYLANRKEQSAIRAVLKCIEEYKLEAEMPSENLKKRLEQLEKVKTEKKRSPPVVPANKRTRVNNNIGPMPPAKAGRIANAYVSSFPATAPTFVPSPPHPSPYHAGFAPPQQYVASPPPPPMYGNRSPSFHPYSPEAASPPYHPYSPEAASPQYHGGPVNYTVYGAYGNAMASPSYTHQAFY